jgi:hypothetical protein
MTHIRDLIKLQTKSEGIDQVLRLKSVGQACCAVLDIEDLTVSCCMSMTASMQMKLGFILKFKALFVGKTGSKSGGLFCYFFFFCFLNSKKYKHFIVTK